MIKMKQNLADSKLKICYSNYNAMSCSFIFVSVINSKLEKKLRCLSHSSH